MMFKQWIGMVLILSTFAFGADETFAKAYGYETSYKEAQTKALKSNKPMMILLLPYQVIKVTENQTLKKMLSQTHPNPLYPCFFRQRNR